MSEDAGDNWDAIIHKNVRSKDSQDAGNVDAIIEGFNGAEVSLKITFGELKKYKV